jgi:hypothetical protein
MNDLLKLFIIDFNQAIQQIFYYLNVIRITDIGSKNDQENCIVICNRSSSLKLNFTISRLESNKFLLKQSYYSLFYELDRLIKQESELEGTNITISDRDNRKIILTWLFNTNLKIIENLLDIYDKLSSFEDNSWIGFTDGSLTRNQFNNYTKYDMGLGWIILKENNEIANFNASSFEWPSSTRMELMAVVSLISSLPSGSSINIHTDSNNIITKYNKLKQFMPYRKQKKVVNFNI